MLWPNDAANSELESLPKMATALLPLCVCLLSRPTRYEMSRCDPNQLDGMPVCTSAPRNGSVVESEEQAVRQSSNGAARRTSDIGASCGRKRRRQVCIQYNLSPPSQAPAGCLTPPSSP